MEDDGSEPVAGAPPDGIACGYCTAPNSPLANFCENCRAPLTAFATTGPFEHAVSWGWGVGEAIGRPRPSTLILVGVWLILLPWISQAAFLMISDAIPWWERAWIVLLDFALPAIGLVLATRHYVRGRRRAQEPPEDDEPDLRPDEIPES